jgi:FMN phosphatase YigB (HAD superfamily)
LRAPAGQPTERLFEAGRGVVRSQCALDLPPRECLFVDDDPALVAAAIELGYRGLAVSRGPHPPDAVPWIATLDQLPPHLDPA